MKLKYVDEVIEKHKPDRIVGYSKDYEAQSITTLENPIPTNKTDEKVIYIYSKVEEFDEFVTKDNWIFFDSFLILNTIPEVREINELSNNILKNIMIVKRARFLMDTFAVSKTLIEKLPKLIESAFLDTPIIKKESKERPIVRYKDNNDPSFKKNDEFDYKYTGQWIEQIVQEHYYDGFKSNIEEKDKASHEWLEKEYYSLGYTDSIRGLDPTKIVLYKIICLAEKSFKNSIGTDWKKIINIFNLIYHSDFSDRKVKEILREEGFILDPNNDSTKDQINQAFEQVRDRMRKTIKNYSKCYNFN